jgi:hypothetical protein
VTAPAPAPAKGLSSVPQVSAILVPEAPERVRLNFPSTELVTAAAGLFHKRPGWLVGLAGGELVGLEGRTWRVEVAAGTVGLAVRDPARRERNRADGLGNVKGLPPGRVLDEDGEWAGEWHEPRPPRMVTGWSRRSRSRMVRRLAQLDYAPMYDTERPAVMVTLTYPGAWEAVVPTGRDCKRQLRALWKRWARRWGTPFVGLWKLEFQRRGAPHLHLLVVPPRDPAFRDWLSAAWTSILDPAWCGRPCWEAGAGACCEYGRSRRAGTGIDYLRGGRCFDPKRAAVYFSKHGGAAGGKEYQHDVPELWQQPGAGPGRFWGYRGLVPVVASAELEWEEYVQLRRTLRRWAKQSGNSRRVVRLLVDSNGVVSYRTRRRKGVQSFTSRGMTGGTVLVNDGPAFASALALMLTCQTWVRGGFGLASEGGTRDGACAGER